MREPFRMEFDGELIIQGEGENENWLLCPSKNVKIGIYLLLRFVKENRPLGYKETVGIPINYDLAKVVGQSTVPTEMHRDQDYVYIGCLKETRESFNKKYVQLVKHLNKNKNVNTEQSGSGASN